MNPYYTSTLNAANQVTESLKNQREQKTIEDILSQAQNNPSQSVLNQLLSQSVAKLNPQNAQNVAAILGNIQSQQTAQKERQAYQGFGLNPYLPKEFNQELFKAMLEQAQTNQYLGQFQQPQQYSNQNVGLPSQTSPNNVYPNPNQPNNIRPNRFDERQLARDQKRSQLRPLLLTGTKTLRDKVSAELDQIDNEEKRDLEERKFEQAQLDTAQNQRKDFLKETLDASDLAEKSKASKQDMIKFVDTHELDDPSWVAFADALPFNLGQRFLNPATSQYRASLIDGYANLRNIFVGQTRNKEIAIYEKKIAEAYLTDDQKKAILRQLIKIDEPTILMGQAARLANEELPKANLGEFRGRVKEIYDRLMKKQMDEFADFNKNLFNQIEQQKKIPLDPQNPDHYSIIKSLAQKARVDDPRNARNPSVKNEILRAIENQGRKDGYSFVSDFKDIPVSSYSQSKTPQTQDQQTQPQQPQQALTPQQPQIQTQFNKPETLSPQGLLNPVQTATQTIDKFFNSPQMPEIPPESGLKNIIRTAAQIPQGLLEANPVNVGIELAKALSFEDLDINEWHNLRRIAEENGQTFDEDKFRQAQLEAQKFFPTVGNAASLIEEKTGAPLTPRTKAQSFLRFASTAGKLAGPKAAIAPSNVTMPGWLAGGGVAAISEAMQTEGVPKPLADIASLLLLRRPRGGGPELYVGPKPFKPKKPPPFAQPETVVTSGPNKGQPVNRPPFLPAPPETTYGPAQTTQKSLPKRQYHKVTQPTEVSAATKAKVVSTAENDFRNIYDDIIASSPEGQTFQEVLENPKMKQDLSNQFDALAKTAETIPGKASATDFKAQVLRLIYENMNKGLFPTTFNKQKAAKIQEIYDSISKAEFTVSDLLTSYRENNADYRFHNKPGPNWAANAPIRAAILAVNDLIAQIIRKGQPDSEFAKTFDALNKAYTKFNDVHTVNNFVDSIFDKGLDFNQASKFFLKEGYDSSFKRILGDKHFQEFSELLNDFIAQKKNIELIRAVPPSTYKDVGVDLFLSLFGHPAAILRTAARGAKAVKKAWLRAILTKPDLIVQWRKGIHDANLGNYDAAKNFMRNLVSTISKMKSTKQAPASSNANPKTNLSGQKPSTPFTAKPKATATRTDTINAKVQPIQKPQAQPQAQAQPKPVAGQLTHQPRPQAPPKQIGLAPKYKKLAKKPQYKGKSPSATTPQLTYKPRPPAQPKQLPLVPRYQKPQQKIPYSIVKDATVTAMRNLLPKGRSPTTAIAVPYKAGKGTTLIPGQTQVTPTVPTPQLKPYQKGRTKPLSIFKPRPKYNPILPKNIAPMPPAPMTVIPPVQAQAQPQQNLTPAQETTISSLVNQITTKPIENPIDPNLYLDEPVNRFSYLEKKIDSLQKQVVDLVASNGDPEKIRTLESYWRSGIQEQAKLIKTNPEVKKAADQIAKAKKSRENEAKKLTKQQQAAEKDRILQSGTELERQALFKRQSQEADAKLARKLEIEKEKDTKAQKAKAETEKKKAEIKPSKPEPKSEEIPPNDLEVSNYEQAKLAYQESKNAYLDAKKEFESTPKKNPYYHIFEKKYINAKSQLIKDTKELHKYDHPEPPPYMPKPEHPQIRGVELLRQKDFILEAIDKAIAENKTHIDIKVPGDGHIKAQDYQLPALRKQVEKNWPLSPTASAKGPQNARVPKLTAAELEEMRVKEEPKSIMDTIAKHAEKNQKAKVVNSNPLDRYMEDKLAYVEKNMQENPHMYDTEPQYNQKSPTVPNPIDQNIHKENPVKRYYYLEKMMDRIETKIQDLKRMKSPESTIDQMQNYYDEAVKESSHLYKTNADVKHDADIDAQHKSIQKQKDREAEFDRKMQEAGKDFKRNDQPARAPYNIAQINLLLEKEFLVPEQNKIVNSLHVYKGALVDQALTAINSQKGKSFAEIPNEEITFRLKEQLKKYIDTIHPYTSTADRSNTAYYEALQREYDIRERALKKELASFNAAVRRKAKKT